VAVGGSSEGGKQLAAAGTVNTEAITKPVIGLDIFGIPIIGISETGSVSVVTSDTAYLYANGGVSTQRAKPEAIQGQAGIDVLGISIEIGGNVGDGVGVSVGVGVGDYGATVSVGVDSQYMAKVGVTGNHNTSIDGNTQKVESGGGEIYVNGGVVAAVIMYVRTGQIQPEYTFQH
jgi:hypothetical protein